MTAPSEELEAIFPGTREWRALKTSEHASSFRGETKTGRPMLARVLRFQDEDAGSGRSRAFAHLQRVQQIVHRHLWPLEAVVDREHLYWLSPWFDPGLSLSLVRRDARKIISIGKQLCEGLDALHRAGVLHLNLHPGNIVAETGRLVRICDAMPSVARTMQTRQYNQLEIVGAHPLYAAPEQITGKQLSEATDVYSLASILYEIAAGEPLWRGRNFLEICVAKAGADAIISDKVPIAIRPILATALLRDSQKRTPTINDLLCSLQQALPQGRRGKTASTTDHSGSRRLSVFAPVQIGFGEHPLLQFLVGDEVADGRYGPRSSDPRAEPRVAFEVAAVGKLVVDVMAGGVTLESLTLSVVELERQASPLQILIALPARAGTSVVELRLRSGNRQISTRMFAMFAGPGDESGANVPAATAPAPAASASKIPAPTVPAAASIAKAPASARERPQTIRPAKSSAVPAKIPGYEFLRKIGVGGMSTVWLAMQKSLQREIAIKLMRRTHDSSSDDARQYENRFLLEGRTMAKLPHRNIVAVYDIVSTEDVAYIAMEFLEGGTLSERMQAGLSLAEAVSVVVQIAGALDFAHGQGIIHRDIKPGNIMFRDAATPVLTDFGIARQQDQAATRLTQTGMLVGTPSYMSPEQISGSDIDGRSDLYSLGIMFYELLSGRTPFTGDTPIAVMMAHLTQPAPPLDAEVSHFQVVLDRMLAKNRDERYATLHDFVVALKQRVVASDTLLMRLQLTPGLTLSEQLRQLGFTAGNSSVSELKNSGKIPDCLPSQYSREVKTPREKTFASKLIGFLRGQAEK